MTELQVPMNNDHGHSDKPITTQVSREAAEAYEEADAVRRRKLDTLRSLKLMKVKQSNRPLEQIMSEISHEAHERGLTPEKFPVPIKAKCPAPPLPLRQSFVTCDLFGFRHLRLCRAVFSVASVANNAD